jgi:hypothetical protein
MHRPRIRRERPRHEVLPPGLDAPLCDTPSLYPYVEDLRQGDSHKLRTSRMRSRGYRVSDDPA